MSLHKNHPTFIEKLYMSNLCDLKININTHDKSYNIKISDNNKIIATTFIHKKETIYIGEYLLKFNKSTENLLAALCQLSDDTILQLCKLSMNYFYPYNIDDIIECFKRLYEISDDKLINEIIKDPLHMIILYTECNNFAPSDDKFRYLYLLGSKFNHSCNPNCDWNIIDDKLIITSIVDIKDGEECTIAYWKLFDIQNVIDRKKIIYNCAGFICNCSYCLDPNPKRQCYNCGQIAKLLRCSKCHNSYYCTRECQKEDWIARHKFSCK